MSSSVMLESNSEMLDCTSDCSVSNSGSVVNVLDSLVSTAVNSDCNLVTSASNLEK